MGYDIPEFYDFFLYLIFSRPGVSSNFSARAVHTTNDARLQPEVPLFGHNWSPTRDEAFDRYVHANFHTNTVLTLFQNLTIRCQKVKILSSVTYCALTWLQSICYSHWENGDQNGVISIGQWGVFYHEKGAI